MYNEQQKERYLKQSNLSEDAKETFRMIASTAAKVESQKDLDLSNFNRGQVIDLLKAYNSKARSYLRLICNNFSKYYSWCSDEGLVDISNFTNWYDVKLSQPIVKEVLPNELIEDKFFDDDYVIDCVINKIKDKQNKLLFYAPYLGIDGVEHEELRYLEIDGLDEKEKTIKLITGRIANVDDLFIELIKDANKSTRYDKNGTGEIRTGCSEYTPSKYVFKSYVKVTSPDLVISVKNINQRYTVIKEQTGNRLLTIPVMYKNGLLNYIRRYFEPQGISLYDVLLLKKDTKINPGKGETKYVYDDKTQELINEFGSNMPVRALRHQMSDIIQYWNDKE
jgi:hypothetical protein